MRTEPTPDSDNSDPASQEKLRLTSFGAESVTTPMECGEKLVRF
jgi:hypothetical protein